MTEIPTKIPFDPPNNGANNFGNQATTALLALPNVVNEADAGNQYQEDLFNTPTSKGILPTPTGLGADTRLLPLRLNDAGTALTADLQSSYSDGGEIVQFKGLDADVSNNLFGYRRQLVAAADEYTITASESNTGDVVIYAIFSGRILVTINNQVVFERTTRFTGINSDGEGGTIVDYRFINLNGDAEVRQDNASFESIRVLKLSLTHSDADQGRTLSADVAAFGKFDIAGAMAEENGYRSILDGHPQKVESFRSVASSQMRTPANASILIGGHVAIPSALFDAQIQTGSGFNFFAS
ncbi:MAG: hypothetical protein K0U41_05810 [Gammaproteobacteria bacterium]|nr:hypothetical protein [Gammaproteobacteria bacterium]